MIHLRRLIGVLSFLLVTWLATALPAPVTAQQPSAAAKKVAELEDELQKARDALSANQKRVAELEKALAGAKRDVMEDIISRARTGDSAALREVFEAQKGGAKGTTGGAGFIEATWARAVQGDAAHHAKIVSLISAELKTKAPIRYRLKLVWLLGQNGSPEAGASLREILMQEKDVDVLGAALAALRRCPRTPGDLEAVKRHVGDERLIKEAIGYFPAGMDVKAGKLGPVAARFAGELDKAGHATVPGEVVVEPPTILCLGFEWHIKGDTNHNCTVEVHYRKKGQQAWQRGCPMTRCENRKHPLPVFVKDAAKNPVARPGVDHGNLLAGSILELEPGTDYEVRLTLNDPDGGSAEKIVTARTRTVPVAWDKAPIRHVVPGDGGGTGTAAEPFRGLVAADAAAKPGDVFLLAPGTYKGGVVLKKKIGEPGKPIVYRGIAAEKTIIDGEKKDDVVSCGLCKHLHFENLTFTNGRKGISATGSEGLVIRGCHFHAISQIGIYAPANKGVSSRNAYIADNVIIGKASWVKGRKQSTYGISICGEGHVICYNRIENHWDGISLAAHPDTRPMNRAIDIYGNDIRQCVDDGIEADKTYYNVRIFRNLLVNCFSAISCQPGYGGPMYILFNLIYNCTNKPFKFHVDPTGLIVAHNTCLTTREAFYGGGFHHAFFRNNLILGKRGEQGYWLSTQANQLDSDYNGYTDTGSRPLIKLNNVRYHDMAAFSAALGLEKHSVQLGLDTFVKAPLPPGQTVVTVPASFDLRLRPDSKAVDAGIHLPGINDGFSGKAPDLGCYELGRPTPVYGSRVEKK